MENRDCDYRLLIADLLIASDPGTLDTGGSLPRFAGP
jgi:hypothetical protein